jgi:hypothetical protein
MQEPTPDLDNACYQAERQRISLAMSEFTLPLMRRVYEAFGGDLVLAIVLGEIGIHNVGAWLGRADNDARALANLGRHEEVLRPCNALSIAEATGIPRETVRRKVAALIKRGLVYRSTRGHLFVHPSAADDFAPMTRHLVVSLLGTARRIEALLATSPVKVSPADSRIKTRR